jgi:hypothetical protein
VKRESSDLYDSYTSLIIENHCIFSENKEVN